MPVLRDIGCLVSPRAGGAQGQVMTVPDAALAFRDGVVRWVGPARDLPSSQDDGQRWSAEGGLVIPGLVDAHTHLAFGGWRADEWVGRIAGQSYAEIARAGGGIASTVAHTRALDAPALMTRARGFAREMAALGVTTIEAKSGYGLDVETELRLLEVYRDLHVEGPLRIVPTYLGAHVVPAEHRAHRDTYVAQVTDHMIPLVGRRGLARFVDVFVEQGAFTADEARRIAGAARVAGLGVKLHADQLTAGQGASLAAELGAVSADHLERVTDEGIAALAAARVVAVTLPFAALTLDGPAAPARKLLAAGVGVAVATDFNPGTAPSYHLPLALTLACLRQHMTPAEALAGATLVAARAVGLEAEVGSLEPGKSADLAVIDAPSVEHWLYHFRANACRLTVRAGVPTYRGGNA